MPVKLYRKKPISIRAIQYKGSQDLSSLSEITEFIGEYFRVRDIKDVRDSVITAEVYDYLHDTWIGVKDGDFIIQGVQGEFYPHDGHLMPEVYDEVWA